MNENANAGRQIVLATVDELARKLCADGGPTEEELAVTLLAVHYAGGAEVTRFVERLNTFGDSLAVWGERR